MSKKKFIRAVSTSIFALSAVTPTLTAVTPIIAQAETIESTNEGYISFNELSSFQSADSEKALANLTVRLSEEQDLIIEGNLPTTYNLIIGFDGELSPVNDGTEVNATVASNLNAELTLSIQDSQTDEVIEETSLDLQAAVDYLTNQTGVDKLNREMEEPLSHEDVEMVDESTDNSFDYEQSSAVQSLLEGESNELDESALAKQYSPLSPFMTLSSSRQEKDGIYTVVSGDNFNSIAASFNLSKRQLSYWNRHITDINVLKVGDKLAVTPAGYEAIGLTPQQQKDLHKGENPSQFANIHEFIDYFAPLAIEVSSQPGEEELYPSLMLAQAIHESGAGRVVEGMSQLSRPPYHNLSGIKARGDVSSVLMWTWEAVSDTFNEVKDNDLIAVRTPEYFQTFPSYEAALQRYANLLRYGRGTGEDFYYRGTWRSNTRDVWEVLDKGGLRAYATDPNYFAAIMRTINNYDLTRFDNTVRISGENRFETATAISREGWNSADTVVIADAFQYADALAGAPLAANLNAPILLSRHGRLDKATASEISRLGAKEAIILGGENALSSQVNKDLRDLGLSTRRIAGDNRYETASLIADELVNRTGSKSAVLVSGEDFADAMSVAPFAAKKGLPIYLTRSGSLSDEVKAASSNVKDWTIIGGQTAVTEKVESELKSNGTVAKRVHGENRYVTNQRVINHYGASASETYIATGQEFADALTGSVLAGRNGTNILLVRNNDSILGSQVDFANTNGLSTFTKLGGETALPNRVGESFRLRRLISQ